MYFGQALNRDIPLSITIEKFNDICSVTISDDLYVNVIFSSLELSRGLTNTRSASIVALAADILDSNNCLEARRKLSLILKSNFASDPSFKMSDMIEFFTSTGINKQWKWSDPKIVLSIDYSAHSFPITAKVGRLATFKSVDHICCRRSPRTPT